MPGPFFEGSLLPNGEQPSFFWRTTSHQTILAVAALTRGFLFGLNKTEVHGLDRFLNLLQSRADYKSRNKGLLTVSNHLSVIDDPLIWGVLPLSFTALDLYNNHRFAFASHDICFKNAFSSHFFTLGRTLPVHRLYHSPYGGPFQATMTEGVRLLSQINPGPGQSFHIKSSVRVDLSTPPSWPRDCTDPFSEIEMPCYQSEPNDIRQYLQPSRYACNSYSWIHVFPEGMIHQSPNLTMRYFKWGFTRLILEPEVCPDVVPMFIEGTEQIMHESRTWPRFIPRAGKTVHVTFGDAVNTEAVFGDLRRKWRQLLVQDVPYENTRRILDGIVVQSLQEHPEAQEIRMECARRVREQVLKVRRSRGYPDEDPKASYAQTWVREGPKRKGRMEDGTWVGDT